MDDTLLPDNLGQHTAPETVTPPVDPVFGIDLRLLRHMGDSILVAHAANPSCWSVRRLESTSFILYVESVTVMVIRKQGGDVAFLGEPDDLLDLDTRHLARTGSYGAYRLDELSPDRFDDALLTNRVQHDAYIESRAVTVKTRTQRAHEHQQDLVDAIAGVTGIPLPEPAYLASMPAAEGQYATAKVAPTGFWKQTIGDPGEGGAVLAENPFLPLDMWAVPNENLADWPADRESFVRQAKLYPRIGEGGGHRLWMFVNGMGAGDRIVMHDRRGSVLLVGEITGPYQHHPDTAADPHRRPVRLHDMSHRGRAPRHHPASAAFATNLWGLTVMQPEHFTAIERFVNGEPEPTPVPIALEPDHAIPDLLAHIREHFAANGLAYTDAQIATFYTALQTKGFVVLSGISGTGKSKIAQYFVELLPGQELAPGMRSNSPHPELLSFTLKPTENWVAIPASQSALFPPIDTDVQQKVILLFRNGLHHGHVILRTLNKGLPTLYLALGKALSDELRGLGPDRPIFATVEMDESGAAVDRIHLTDSLEPTASRDADPASVPHATNSLFLSVRPDWRDSTSLLGYWNPLTENYEWTDFLRFLLRATESLDRRDGLAWFVILDEMNLAHVEYYFADLLSVIESGRRDDGTSREPLRLTWPDAHLGTDVPPRELHLPPNLYVIGTVNMDETTHAFSPKVLDRAFTIELKDVSFRNYPPQPAADRADLSAGERQAMLLAFTRDGAFHHIDKDDIRRTVDAHPMIRDWLETLNIRLDEDDFSFGYRVFDEIAQFVHNAEENDLFAGMRAAPWLAAFDHAVYMKVLPKFTGSHARLLGPLTTLCDWARDPAKSVTALTPPVTADVSTDDDGSHSTTGPKIALHRVLARAERMLKILDANGFVSFG